MAKLRGDEYLAECVEIEPLALQEEYVRLPADFAYWNARNKEAVKTYLLAKIAADRTYAMLMLEYRQKLSLTEAKVTEATVKATVEVDERWQGVQVALVEAECEKVEKHGILDTLRAKKEMLISLGAHIRQEMNSDPTVRTAQREYNQK